MSRKTIEPPFIPQESVKQTAEFIKMPCRNHGANMVPEAGVQPNNTAAVSSQAFHASLCKCAQRLPAYCLLKLNGLDMLSATW